MWTCPTCGSPRIYDVHETGLVGDGTVDEAAIFCYRCLVATLEALGVPRMVQTPQKAKG